MFGLKYLSKVRFSQREALTFTGGLTLGSGLILWSGYKFPSAEGKEEDYIRTLDINAADVDKQHSQRLVASIDTGADHSIISREIVKKLNLPQQKIAQDDPSFTTLMNNQEMKFDGKVTFRFHMVESPEPHHVLQFNRYKNTGTFFVPSSDEFAAVDVCIGKDNISKLLLRPSFSLGCWPSKPKGKDAKTGPQTSVTIPLQNLGPPEVKASKQRIAKATQTSASEFEHRKRQDDEARDKRKADKEKNEKGGEKGAPSGTGKTAATNVVK
ncbi:hypothetical protein EG327_003331 [Venturia inaequalis]|uniref:Peptidase A2 domain-containing protein n=1 Tax=Venturia inaequalis TaxID=5025 RepID=A0A8H3VGV2_VENIN|nr:hypothetical protein EG327_003331 [Venturia inaequalis]